MVVGNGRSTYIQMVERGKYINLRPSKKYMNTSVGPGNYTRF